MRSIVKQADQFNLRTAEPVAAPPAPAAPKTYQPIYKEDLSTPDARRSRPVSHGEFQQLAAEGEKRFNRLQGVKLPTSALDDNWDNHVQEAYKQTREPWGGATINANTGAHRNATENLYAMTTRKPGQNTIEIDPNGSYEDFHKAMTGARQQFGDQLSHPGGHLGVFHDADVNKVQFDPTYVTPRHSDVETMGAYTRNVGGAYHFKSGDGFWPPHVDPSLG